MRPYFLAAACTLAVACTEHHVIISDGPGAPAEPPSDGADAGPTDTTQATNPLFVDLGAVPLDTDVSFDVPEGALGFTIIVQSKVSDFDPDHPFGVERITNPSGGIVHDDFRPNGGTSDTSIAQFDSIAAASVPQGDAPPDHLGGTWKVRFGIKNPTSSQKPTLTSKVRIQSSGDGTFHGGTLDIHLHVPAGLTIGSSTVTAPESDPLIKQRVDAFFGLTSQLLGFERGDVAITSEDASYQKLDGGEQLLAGFAISKGETAGAQRLHILMTNLIADNGEAFAAGIAPGIPGAAGVFGRNVSGIIVTTSDSYEADAITMLHESGHFFGLNHTTEFDGAGQDPLSDTPVCPDLKLSDQHSFFSCPDRKNIMFPAGAIDTPVTLSPIQKRVYRGSPIYKAATVAQSQTKMLVAPSSFRQAFRLSGGAQLSPVEQHLTAGFCGLTKIDPQILVQRFGRANAVAQLKAAASDADLVPFIRGRARLALKALGESVP